MSCLEKVKDSLPAKGEGLAGGMTVAHLQDLTGYSRSAVEQALRVLAARQEARKVMPAGEDRQVFGTAGIWFQWFAVTPRTVTHHPHHARLHDRRGDTYDD